MTTQPNPNPTLPLDPDQLKRLLQRAREADTACLPELRGLLHSHPALWKDVGDIAVHAEMNLIRLSMGKDLFAFESVRLRLAEIKAELSGPSPTPLEKLLIDRIGVCWLYVYYLDSEATKVQPTTPQSVWVQKSLDSANRRYLAGIRQLATVRNLLAIEQPDSAQDRAVASKPKSKKRLSAIKTSA